MLFAGQAPADRLRALAALYRESVHVVVRADMPISGIADLRGRRVSIDEPGSGTRVEAQILLKAFGLGEGDLEITDSPTGASRDALEAGRLDAFFLVAGWPIPAITELVRSGTARLLSLRGPNVERLLRARPLPQPRRHSRRRLSWPECRRDHRRPCAMARLRSARRRDGGGPSAQPLAPGRPGARARGRAPTRCRHSPSRAPSMAWPSRCTAVQRGSTVSGGCYHARAGHDLPAARRRARARPRRGCLSVPVGSLDAGRRHEQRWARDEQPRARTAYKSTIVVARDRLFPRRERDGARASGWRCGRQAAGMPVREQSRPLATCRPTCGARAPWVQVPPRPGRLGRRAGRPSFLPDGFRGRRGRTLRRWALSRGLPGRQGGWSRLSRQGRNERSPPHLRGPPSSFGQCPQGASGGPPRRRGLRGAPLGCPSASLSFARSDPGDATGERRVCDNGANAALRRWPPSCTLIR